MAFCEENEFGKVSWNSCELGVEWEEVYGDISGTCYTFANKTGLYWATPFLIL